MDIDFGSDEDWSGFVEQVAGHGGAMVPCPEGVTPAPLVPTPMSFKRGARVLVEVTGTVVHIGPDGTLALMFEPDAREAIANVTLTSRPRATSPMSAEDGTQPWKKYESLTKAEKIRLAKYGSAAERRLVLRDSDASLHVHVLNNPGLKGTEVAAMIRGGAPATFVRKITERAELLGNAAVAEALVYSPVTPLKLAVKLVGRISITKARRIAKAGNLRQAVVAAARKRVITR